MPKLGSKRKYVGKSFVKIAVELEDGKRLIGNFSSSFTLWALLEEIGKQNNTNLTQRSSFEKDSLESSEGFYMMPNVRVQNVEVNTIEQLRKVTLIGLGLEKGGVVIRLSFKISDIKYSDIPEILKKIKNDELELEQKTANEIVHQETLEKEIEQKQVEKENILPTKSFDYLMGRIDRQITTMCRQANGTELQNTLSTLQKITLNVSKRPINPKHKNLRVSNEKLQERIFRFENAMFYLECLGFSKDSSGDSLVFDDKEADIKVALGAYDMLLRAKPIIDSVEAKEIPEIDRQLKVYNADFLRRFRVTSVKLESNSSSSGDDHDDEDDDLVTNDRILLKIGIADDKRLATEQNLGLFVSREKFESIKVRRQYEIVVIRVHFPTKIVIEGCFHPRETIGDIMKFISELLLKEYCNKSFMFRLPPSTNLGDPDCTISDAKLVPAATLYFQWSKHSHSNDTDLNVDLGILRPEIIEMITEDNVSNVPEAINSKEASKQPDYRVLNKIVKKSNESERRRENVSSSRSLFSPDSSKSNPNWLGRGNQKR